VARDIRFIPHEIACASHQSAH